MAAASSDKGKIQMGKHAFPSRTKIAQWRKKDPLKVWVDGHGREYGPLKIAAFKDTGEPGETWWCYLPTPMLEGNEGKTRTPALMMEFPEAGETVKVVNSKDPSLQFEAEVMGFYEIAKWLRTSTLVLDRL